MKKQKNSPRIASTHLLTFLFAIIGLLSACSESELILPAEHQPNKNPYIKLGEYQSNDAYHGKVTESYLMNIQTVGGRNDHFVISNFANLGKTVTAYGNDKGISIHGQSLGIFGEVEYRIDHGFGVQTEEGIEISVLIHEGELCQTKNIRATYNGQ